MITTWPNQIMVIHTDQGGVYVSDPCPQRISDPEDDRKLIACGYRVQAIRRKKIMRRIKRHLQIHYGKQARSARRV